MNEVIQPVAPGGGIQIHAGPRVHSLLLHKSQQNNIKGMNTVSDILKQMYACSPPPPPQMCWGCQLFYSENLSLFTLFMLKCSGKQMRVLDEGSCLLEMYIQFWLRFLFN